MNRISQEIALKNGSSALVTGESLAQVASQTLRSMVVTNEVAKMPVLRPLVGLDKIEIIEYARKIGEEYAKGKTQDERICNAANAVNGTVYAQGVVEELQLETKQLNRLSQRASIWLCRTAWVTRRQ